MNATIHITLPKQTREKLVRLALRYGLSLTEFSSKVIGEISEEIPEESFGDYAHPKRLRRSFDRAIRDWKEARYTTRL